MTTKKAIGRTSGEVSCTGPQEGRQVARKPLRSLYVHKHFTIIDTLSNVLACDYCLEETHERFFMQNRFSRKGKYGAIGLCEGAEKIMTLPNAGGNSVHSEALSFEVLHCMFHASLMATEMELKYWPENSKITDFSIRIHGVAFGVSVTRAMKFRGDFFTEADAERLLSKKLFGVVCSSRAVMRPFKWKKQILHIWAQTEQIARMLRHVYDHVIDANLKSNTLVIVTVAANADWVFFERED